MSGLRRLQTQALLVIGLPTTTSFMCVWLLILGAGLRFKLGKEKPTVEEKRSASANPTKFTE
jgi:hypothetical protein